MAHKYAKFIPDRVNVVLSADMMSNLQKKHFSDQLNRQVLWILASGEIAVKITEHQGCLGSSLFTEYSPSNCFVSLFSTLFLIHFVNLFVYSFRLEIKMHKFKAKNDILMIHCKLY